MRAVSLSQEPLFSVLQKELVCGYRDISKEKWAGFSGRHEIGGNAVNTTNGAGPHNMQIFLLSGDGTVLHCLPGFWNPVDLVGEVEFAARLHDVWTNPNMDYNQKRQVFSQMQLAHISEHSSAMVARSKMQNFDKQYELKRRFNTDTIVQPTQYATVTYDQNHAQQGLFKSTDQIMHERMAVRPFIPYAQFDVVAYSDYGRPKYDKNEDFRGPDGVNKDAARKQDMIGQVPEKEKKRNNRSNKFKSRRTARLLNQGAKAVLWGLR
ncbi:MAG: hypothetical protein K2Z81_10050 [Cyanobacteria bacterium]|nr:hypothetical protein [Cyanobacteriota bacterium]